MNIREARKQRIAAVRRLGALRYSTSRRGVGAARSRGPTIPADDDRIRGHARSADSAGQTRWRVARKAQTKRPCSGRSSTRSRPTQWSARRLAKSAEAKGRLSFRSLVTCRNAPGFEPSKQCRKWKGRLVWESPFLTHPGVGSGRVHATTRRPCGHSRSE